MKRFANYGLILAAFALAVLFASCGQFFPSASTITSITVSPASAIILPTGTQQYSATGTFGNNTTGDVTSQVTWRSSATNIATIDTSGLATAVALGTANISASSGSVTSSVSPLTVSNKTIVSISVSPQNTTLTSGTQQQYTATATYNDNSTGNVTTQVTWSSSDTTVATISTTGLATAVGTGTTTISAVLTVTGSTTLTVQ